MAQRTVCMSDGKYIGIESIYTVINGQQINIPKKLKELRMKSQHNQLFCPCGCGANLTLVAGDRNLREQHFRLKDSELYKECSVITEGRISVDSKIVLKCWLDDKLYDENIESRVSISSVDDIERKYEFTFFSEKYKLAISYCHDKANLSDEKFNILENNSKSIKIIYIADCTNRGTNGQYPERLMKIQDRQGYCLYLYIDGADYYNAKLESVFYEQDIDGFWQEILFAEGYISEYSIDDAGDLLYKEEKIFNLLEVKKNEHYTSIEKIKRLREQERIIQAENLRKSIEKEAIKRKEKEKLLKEANAENKQLIEKAERIRKEREEKHRIENENKLKELVQNEKIFKEAFKSDSFKQDIVIKDKDGKRWFECESCGKRAKESEFWEYGGTGRLNFGTCKGCLKNDTEESMNMEVKDDKYEKFEKLSKKEDINKCPKCEGQLKEKNGQYGKFIGCSNFPICRYTEKFRK